MLLCDWEIRRLAMCRGMINPFYDAILGREFDTTHPVHEDHLPAWPDECLDHPHHKGKISFGISSSGYDLRVKPRWKVFTNAFGAVIDPKAFDPKVFIEMNGDSILIPPNSYTLAETVETFDMPNNVTAIVLGKSTLARCALLVNCTPLEPGWRGVLTVEISNLSTLPVKIYANEGMAQLLFFRHKVPHATYAWKKGKYQHQKELTLPIVK